MACDVPGLDVAGIVDAAHHSRIVRGWLDAFDAAVSTRSDQLHTTGQGIPAEELHARSGGVSAAEGRRRGRRAKVLDKAPSLADALAAGEVAAEHADVIADHLQVGTGDRRVVLLPPSRTRRRGQVRDTRTVRATLPQPAVTLGGPIRDRP